ncbi:MAG TPA: DNA repair protein RecO, partial [Paracoccaceae bacterium]|nr:DNA repair protein RecO [Paracoccaceae bacterium]
SASGGAEYADRLLPLPRFLRLEMPIADSTDIAKALHTTGHFLQHWVMPALGRENTPAARERLLAALARHSQTKTGE